MKKITQLFFIEGRRYLDNYQVEWEVRADNLYSKQFNLSIESVYNVRQIAGLNFRELPYWEYADVDTPVLVSMCGDIWSRAYFAKYEDGKIFTFPNGRTSWSSGGISNLIEWKMAVMTEDK